MFQQFRIASLLLISLTVLTGVIYPAIMTLVAQVLFPFQANGSIIQNGDVVIGSELIGQSFTRPEYFWSRLSATSTVPYNAAASSGSNFGPMNPALVESAEQRLGQLDSSENEQVAVPVDLVTSSASGLDPHITPAAAAYQVARVAAARSISEDQTRELVHAFTEDRTFGVLGESRVNVLKLNLALDRLSKGR